MKNTLALDWWNNLGMQNMVEPLDSWSGYCMKYYPDKTDCQTLTDEEIESIYNDVFKNI